MAWTTIGGSERELWDYVARMESYDYVARIYEQFNGSPAPRSKNEQINAAFAQGRMYFENARLADLGVKPLLLYYGVMSHAVGLVLLKDPNKEEGSLKAAHGLKPGNWKQVLAGGVDRVLDLDVRCTEGTFRDLVAITWHWNIANVYQNVRERQTFPELRELGSISFANDESRLTLADLLSRSKHTGADYSAITGGQSNLRRVIVELTNGNNTLTMRLHDPLRKRSGGDLEFPRRSSAVPLWYCNDKDVFMSLAEDFPNGDRLSEFLKLHLISFVLGMLARYFPSKWIALIRHDAGSSAQPLLAKAIRSIETDYVREIAQQIAVVLDDPYFFGEHFGQQDILAAYDWRDGWKDPAA